MNLFNIFKKQEKQVEVITNQPMMSTFSTPFGKIGQGNLSLPYVRANIGGEQYVRFGSDNLFPSILNQLYYTSPLHGGIINFKANSVIGGGFEIISKAKTAKEKVEEYSYTKRIYLDKLSRQLTKDLIMHERVHLLICNKNGQKTVTRLSPEKVRYNENKNLFTTSDDWSRNANLKTYPAYNPSIQGDSIYLYENDLVAGQDYYPIPSYCSANNWMFVDGEMAYLQKSNIINSIFPSFMLTMAKKFESSEEAQGFRDIIDNAKGAPNAGRIMAFVSEFPENLPTVTPLPQNNNDKLFIETITNIESNICRSHQLDPLIIGIRPSGKLGSGAELPQAYAIFEKNVVMPLRRQITEILNDIMLIGGFISKIEINNFQVIENEITQVKSNSNE